MEKFPLSNNSINYRSKSSRLSRIDYILEKFNDK